MPKNTPIELLMNLEEISADYKPQSLDSGFPPQYVNSNYQQQIMSENQDREGTSGKIMGSRIRQSSNMRKAMNAGIDPRIYDMDMNVNVMDNEVYQLGPKARNVTPQSPPPPPPYPQHNRVPSNSPHFNYLIEGYDNPPRITCIDVANHIQNCPICSKFYENDKSIYVITIVILLIMCIILVKKLIDCYNKH